jgi:hypothetical protein
MSASSGLEWKTKGNEMFRKQRYNDAITHYTAGLEKCGPGETKLQADLLCNRSAGISSHVLLSKGEN